MTDGSAEMGRLARDLAATPARVRPQVEAILTKAATDIQAGAQNRAPVDTGNLRGSISTSTSRSASAFTAEVGPTAAYGGYVEHGTSRMRAQPYLRPATDAVLPGLEAALRQVGGDIL